jgi:hypothetical protein
MRKFGVLFRICSIDRIRPYRAGLSGILSQNFQGLVFGPALFFARYSQPIRLNRSHNPPQIAAIAPSTMK